MRFLLTLCTLACAVFTHAAQARGIQDELFAYTQPKLTIGQQAPSLSIDSWPKGEPVRGFEPGHVYVVEFWATWCGPCIKGFPTLTKLQSKYEGNVTVIGVNVFERTNSPTQRHELITQFMAEHGENMGYTVAVESGKTMANEWMYAANRRTIPSAFIVDKQGRVAWMGSPYGLEEPIDQILADEFDIQETAEEYRKYTIAKTAIDRTIEAYRTGNTAKGDEMATAFLSPRTKAPDWARVQLIETLARGDTLKADIGMVVAAAKALARDIGRDEPGTYQLLSYAQEANGNLRAAIATQKRAVRDAKNEKQGAKYQERLDSLEQIQKDSRKRR